MAKTFRLYRRDPVEAGKWYLSATCKGCSKPIHAIDDPNEGSSDALLKGNGVFVITCPSCLHDDNYPHLEPMKAISDRPATYPERVDISKASRKPLHLNYSAANPVLGVGYVEDRPQAASIIARIITAWPDVEVQCARLLAELMGTNIPAAAAVFGSLRSSRAQYDALAAAAAVTLDERDLDLFNAHMVRRAALEKERNDIAHGCFGVAPSIPKGVIWVSQTDLLQFNAEFASGDQDKARAAFRRKQFVYELGTLERIAQEIEELYNQIRSFTGYVWARNDGEQGKSFRAQRYPQLCNQPHIAEALHKIRTEREGGQEPRGSRRSKQKRRP